MFPLTVLWSIYIAFQYAKLWSEGFDWRDVFRQPRDRELLEVFEEAMEYVRAVFNPVARAQLRARRDERRALARMGAPPACPPGMEAVAAGELLRGAQPARAGDPARARPSRMRATESASAG
jgi:hypothetical protein